MLGADPLLRLLQWRATRDFQDPQFLGPRIVDKVVLALIIMTLYWKIGDNRALSNYSNLTAVLFLWTILPGYAATAFIPTIVLERPLFVRCAPAPWCVPALRCDWLQGTACARTHSAQHPRPGPELGLMGRVRAVSGTMACTGPSRTWCSR